LQTESKDFYLVLYNFLASGSLATDFYLLSVGVISQAGGLPSARRADPIA